MHSSLSRAALMGAFVLIAGCAQVLGADFDNAQAVTLTVVKVENPTGSGTGNGTIAVNGDVLKCDRTCEVSVAPHSTIELLATADASSAFHSWAPGACEELRVPACRISVGTEDQNLGVYFVGELTNLWARSLGATGYAYATGLSSDPRGNVLVAGVFQGQLNLSGETLTSRGSDDGFVAKLDPHGEPLASVSVGGAGLDHIFASISTEDGSSIVAAETDTLADSTFFIGKTELTANVDGQNGAAVIELDSALEVQGVWQPTGGGLHMIHALSSAPDGSLFAVGEVAGSIAQPDGSTAVSDDRDILIAKLGSGAQLLSAQLIGGPEAQFATSWVSSKNGVFYLSGGFEGSADLGGSCAPLTAPAGPAYHGFVAQFDTQGKCVKARRIVQGNDLASVSELLVDGSGSVLVYGTFEGTVDFSLGTDPSGILLLKASLQSFAVKLGPGLDWIAGSSWVVRVPANARLASMALSDDGQILLGTSSSGTWSDAPPEYLDIELTTLAGDGAELVRRRFGGRSDESVRRVVWDSASKTWLMVGAHGGGLMDEPIDFGGIASNPLWFGEETNALVTKFSP